MNESVVQFQNVHIKKGVNQNKKKCGFSLRRNDIQWNECIHYICFV